MTTAETEAPVVVALRAGVLCGAVRQAGDPIPLEAWIRTAKSVRTSNENRGRVKILDLVALHREEQRLAPILKAEREEAERLAEIRRRAEAKYYLRKAAEETKKEDERREAERKRREWNAELAAAQAQAIEKREREAREKLLAANAEREAEIARLMDEES